MQRHCLPCPQDHVLYRGVCVLLEQADRTADLVARLAFRGTQAEDDGALVKPLAELTREFCSSLQLQDGELADADGDNTGMFLPEWGALLSEATFGTQSPTCPLAESFNWR
jgi:hypothetical protein